VLVLTTFTTAAPQRDGLLAVGQIFGPHLFLPILLLVPFALMRGMVGLRVVLLLCLSVFFLRFTPSLGAAGVANPDASQISVLTWNVFAGNARYDEMSEMLAARPADVVLLQESDWRWVEDENAVTNVYPYRLTETDGAPPGMVFLSVYPILQHGTLDGERDLWDIPRLMWAEVDLGGGRQVTMVDAHPMSAYRVGAGCALPVCYSPRWRDEQIEAMRESYISPMLASGEPLIVAGDFNVTEREPAYWDLSRGLTDAWKAVGSGFGMTWRPAALMDQRVGLLRIDYLFSSPNVMPLTMSVDCTPRESDHCVVVGRFETK
jgi:endonuclease/exonuclease/phosphatase (EEP) superfamily protein YafD